MRSHTHALLPIVLALGAALASRCGGRAPPTLVGRWAYTDSLGDPSELDLNADHSAAMVHGVVGCEGRTTLAGFTWTADAHALTLRSDARLRCTGQLTCDGGSPAPLGHWDGCSYGSTGEAPPAQPYTLSDDGRTLVLSGQSMTRVE